MKIGELALATGTPVATIRYYERQHLLDSPARSSANYRVYEAGDVQRLGFIRHCRSLDMTLDEIRQLLRFRDAPAEDCGAVNDLLDGHIGHVATRIRELRALEKQLRALRSACHKQGNLARCGILAELSQVAEQSPDAGHVPGAHGRGRR